MTAWLLDGNVLIAMALRQHPHRARCLKWFAGIQPINPASAQTSDFGLRVQYSFFECHFDQEEFQHLWNRLLDLIDPEQDRLVAYRLDAKTAGKTLTAGTMVCSEMVVCYLI